MESKIKKILENKFQNKVKYNKEGNVVTYDSSVNLEDIKKELQEFKLNYQLNLFNN